MNDNFFFSASQLKRDPLDGAHAPFGEVNGSSQSTGRLLVLIPLVAAYLFGVANHPAQLWLSIGVAAVVFWTLGVMHNYAHTRDDPPGAPDWAATLCMLGSLAGIVMLVWALLA